jgi:hypothetical protein
MRKYLGYTLRFLIAAAVGVALFYHLKMAPVTVSAFTGKRGPIDAEVMGTGTLTAHTKATISPKIQGAAGCVNGRSERHGRQGSAFGLPR